MYESAPGSDEKDEHQRLLAFQTLLDGSRHASESVVDLTTLRRLCADGVPEHPPHLRPLAYALLLETVPREKKEWKPTFRAQRDRYHHLVKTLMEELESQPTTSSFTYDDLLRQISRDTKSLKSKFWRTRTQPTRSSPFRPLSDSELLYAVAPDTDASADTNRREGHDSDDDDYYGTKNEDQAPGAGTAEAAHLLSRRAIYKRIDLLAEIEYKGGFAKSSEQKPRVGSTENGDDIPTHPTLPPDEAMSPKITLSVDPSPMLSRLDSIRPPRLNTSSLLPSSASVAVNGSPDGSINGDSVNHKPPSPITLLSPKPLPTSNSALNGSGSGGLRSGGLDSPYPFSGSMYHAESHLEALIRMIYVLVRTSHQWRYQSSMVTIASNFYLIHAGVFGQETESKGISRGAQGKEKGNVTKRRRGEQGTVSTLDHIEERTFWAFSSFISELDDLFSTESGLSQVSGLYGMSGALTKLSARLRWANPPYAEILNQRNLEPTLYAYRWFSELFIHDLPNHAQVIPPLLDFIISEQCSTASSKPKTDLIIDIAVAMVLLVKDLLLYNSQAGKRTTGLWGTAEPELEEDDDTAFVRNLDILRKYPLGQMGGIRAVIGTAAELREARLLAVRRGHDPDRTPGPGSRKASVPAPASDRQYNGGGNVDAISGSNVITNGNRTRSESTPTVSSSWGRASAFFSSLSGSAAAVAAGTGSQLQNHAQGAVPNEEASAVTGPTTPSRVPAYGRSSLPVGHKYGPSSPLSPLSNPKVEQALSYDPDKRDSRLRSDSLASNGSIVSSASAPASTSGLSMTERLAKLTHSTPPVKQLPLPASGTAFGLGHGRQPSSPLPRPLLLSGSARRPSHSHMRRRESSESYVSSHTRTPSASASASASAAVSAYGSASASRRGSVSSTSTSTTNQSTLLSPPAGLRSPPASTHGHGSLASARAMEGLGLGGPPTAIGTGTGSSSGLYRIGSRHRSSLGASIAGAAAAATAADGSGDDHGGKASRSSGGNANEDGGGDLSVVTTSSRAEAEEETKHLEGHPTSVQTQI